MTTSSTWKLSIYTGRYFPSLQCKKTRSDTECHVHYDAIT